MHTIQIHAQNLHALKLTAISFLWCKFLQYMWLLKPCNSHSLAEMMKGWQYPLIIFATIFCVTGVALWCAVGVVVSNPPNGSKYIENLSQYSPHTLCRSMVL